MNKIHSKVWNRARGQLVVASELVSSNSSGATGGTTAARAGIARPRVLQELLPVARGVLLKSTVAAIVFAVPLFGYASTISNNGGTAACSSATYTGADGVVFTAPGAVANQYQTDGNGYYSLVAGCGATGNSFLAATLFGAGTQVSGNYGSALGFMSQAGAYATAVGTQANASGPGAIAIGTNGVKAAQATASSTIAIGGQSVANAQGAIAIGSAYGGVASTSSGGINSIAIGIVSTVTGQRATAIGSDTAVYGNNGFAGGASAIANGNNSAALGSGAVAGVAGSSTTITSDLALGDSARATGGSSIAEGNRQITGVAAGKAGTDAVNVSQLAAVTTQLTTLISNQSGGSGGFPSTPGSSTPPPSTGSNSSAGGRGAVIHDPNSPPRGNASNASGNGSTAVGQGATSTGSNSVAMGADSNDGGRANVVAVGAANAPRQFANVGPGTDGTDAVNVNQLNASLSQANAYTDQRVNQLQQGISSTARNAYSGIAAATALTMIPEVDKGKTLSLGIGTAGFRGYQAVAIGGTARVTENIKVKAGIGMSSAGDTVGVGAAMQW